MRKGIVWALVCMMVAVGIVACGGGGSSDPAPSNNTSTYSISGTVTASSVGLQGVTMTLSGSSSATVTSDASGNFTFTSLANGNYTITPSKTGYTFSPISSAQTVSNANISNVNYTATASTATTYSISGAVTSSSTGLASVTMTLSGTGSGSVNTDSSGNYTFTGLANGSYTVTPSKTGYAFLPANSAQTVNSANVTAVNFTGTQSSTDVSGIWTTTAVDSTNNVIAEYLTFSQSGSNLSGTSLEGATISGVISSSTITFTLTYPGPYVMSATGTVNNTTMWGSFSDTDGLSGTWSATKGISDSNATELNYWPASTDKWWISSLVFTQSASRVYLTSSYITGQYDLYKCSTTSGIERWWSSNNAACTEGNNNYKVTSTPTLPFDVTLHIVKSGGEVTYTRTIANYITQL